MTKRKRLAAITAMVAASTGSRRIFFRSSMKERTAISGQLSAMSTHRPRPPLAGPLGWQLAADRRKLPLLLTDLRAPALYQPVPILARLHRIEVDQLDLIGLDRTVRHFG